MNSNPTAYPMAGSACAFNARSTNARYSPARRQTICLQRGEVLRLEKKSGVKNIETRTGIVWLTSTPAEADVLLKSGGQFELESHWPYLIEALEPVELSLSSL